MDSRIKRIEWIDNAKGICMIAVIFSHVLLKPISATPFYTPWFLTGFFFISGFLFFNPDKTMDVKQKYMNILTSILLPYISYWFISFAVDHLTYLQPIITQYFIDNKSEIWLLFLIAHSKR